MTKRTKKKSAKLPTYKSGNTLFDHPGAVTVTGEVDGDYISKLTALPFVRDGKPGKGRCFWSVKSTGKYEDDWEQGRQYARLAVEFLKYNMGSSLISHIVSEMIHVGPTGKFADGSPKVDGIVLGFVTELADHIKYYRGEMKRVA